MSSATFEVTTPASSEALVDVMHDPHQTVQLNEQLQSLIAKWKGVE